MIQITPRMRQGMERMQAGAAGKADCVPVYAQLSHHAAKLAGESTVRFYRDAETFLRCQLAADELYQLDSPTTHYDCYNIEAEALGAELIWNESETPEVSPSRPLMKSVDDLESLRPIRMGAGGRMPFVLELNARLAELGLPPKVRFCGVFSLAAKLLGFETLLTACVCQGDRVHRLLTHLCDNVLAPWIDCQRRACGVNDTATGSEAYASPPILTPPMVREFCLHYIQRLQRQVGKIRLAGLWGERCCKDPRELLDIKREGCPGQFQALDPDVSALGPALFKRYADEHGMSIIMGLDAALIHSGPPAEIRARAQRFLNEAAGDGRFVLFLNDIPYDTPPDNVHAAVQTGHAFRY